MWPYFGCAYLGDGQPMATGNVQSVAGVAGTFAQGISAGYPYQDWPDNYVDELGEAGGTVFLRDQSSVGRAVHHAASSYRTIFSAVAYSALGRPGRTALLRGYLNYLLGGTGLEEQAATELRGIVVSPNPVRGAVSFFAADANGILEIRDASGRIVRALTGNSAGRFHWDGRDAGGGLVPSGTYFARLTGSGAPARPVVILR